MSEPAKSCGELCIVDNSDEPWKARLGGELTALHLLESPKLDQPMSGI